MAGYAFANPPYELARQISDHEVRTLIDERAPWLHPKGS